MLVEDWLGLKNQLPIDIWNKKYRASENETFEEWLDRVSGNDPNVKALIREKKFLFGGRVLANRGLDNKTLKATLANCYCIPVKDNLESIFKALGEMARTYSYGGGVGITLSNIAPVGAKVNNAAKESSGALSFAEIYNAVTGIVGQANRRGALMLAMSSEHPDLENFITVKSDLNKLTKANLSVMASDAFMEAALKRENYTLSFTRETGEIISKTVNAGKVFDKFIENNWNYAEPGILFWDKIKNWTMISQDPQFKFESVNPCSEKPLPAYGNCCLGSINLLSYVKYGINSGKYYFDWDALKADIPIIVKAMNDVLDEGIPLHPLKEQKEIAAKYREIGIGVMGFSSALILLKLKYGSDSSLIFADALASMLIDESAIASAKLAEKEGPYPAYNFDYVSKSEFYKTGISEKTKRAIEKYGLRNSQLLSIAPTGSLSALLSCSGGIEPLFAISYNRRTESLHGESVSYKVYDPIVKQIMDELNITDEKDLPDYVITSAEIDPISRVRMQATWQKYIDASISSTVNLPKTATTKDIKNIYLEAWKQGLKGITVFRSGCAREGILTTNSKEEVKEDIPDHVKQVIIRYMDTQLKNEFVEYQESIKNNLERGQWKPIAPDTLYYPIKIKIGCGTIKLFVGFSESEQAIQDFELRISGSGGCERSLQDLVITMSGIIRLGGTIDNIAKAFKGVRGCNSFASTRTKGIRTLSEGNNCGNAILNAIKKFCIRMKKKEMILSEYGTVTINEFGNACEVKELYGLPVAVSTTLIKKDNKNIISTGMKCPECGEDMAATNGCLSCMNCGYSKCD